MKIAKLSLAAIMAAGLCNVASANSLTEALKAGKISGEVTTTYEKRDVEKKVSNYYQDTAYSVGSFALEYKSGVWNNLDLTAKFRAYKTLFEDDAKSTTGKGIGDASERFWENGNNKSVDFEKLFVTYKNDNVSIKVGRQPLNTKWLNKTHDGVNANFKFGATNVEMIWSRAMGRVTSRDYRPLSSSETNGFMNLEKPNAGVYKLGLTHDLGDVDLMAFYLTAPSFKDLYGGQISYDNGTFGLSAQYSVTSEKGEGNEVGKTEQYKDSTHTELKAFYKVAGYTTTFGYLMTGDENFKHFGMGTTNAMEEGDQIFLKNARTAYLKVNKKFGDLSATLIYGQTDYDKGTTSYDKDETTLWLAYPVTKDLKANLGYTVTNEDNDDPKTTDLNQLNLTLTYSF